MSLAGPRRGRNPNNDLARHIITGEKGPFDSIGIANDLDDCYINYDNPMEHGGSAQLFEGDSDGSKNDQNLAEATNLDSAAGLGQEFPIESFNENNDHGPDSGRSNVTRYGIMNTNGNGR